MSIKSTIKRLESQIAKNSSGRSVTFKIPYCTDSNYTREIQQRLIRDYGLENNRDVLIVFVIDFAPHT